MNNFFRQIVWGPESCSLEFPSEVPKFSMVTFFHWLASTTVCRLPWRSPSLTEWVTQKRRVGSWEVRRHWCSSLENWRWIEENDCRSDESTLSSTGDFRENVGWARAMEIGNWDEPEQPRNEVNGQRIDSSFSGLPSAIGLGYLFSPWQWSIEVAQRSWVKGMEGRKRMRIKAASRFVIRPFDPKPNNSAFRSPFSSIQIWGCVQTILKFLLHPTSQEKRVIRQALYYYYLRATCALIPNPSHLPSSQPNSFYLLDACLNK